MKTERDNSLIFSDPAAMAKPNGYSHLVKVPGGWPLVFISGQLGLDQSGRLVGEPGDFEAQAHQAFKNFGAALESAGSSFDDLFKLNMYLVDIQRHLPTLRAVRDMYIKTSQPPASTTVGIAALALPGALFEVEGVAVLRNF